MRYQCEIPALLFFRHNFVAIGKPVSAVLSGLGKPGVLDSSNRVMQTQSKDSLVD